MQKKLKHTVICNCVQIIAEWDKNRIKTRVTKYVIVVSIKVRFSQVILLKEY